MDPMHAYSSAGFKIEILNEVPQTVQTSEHTQSKVVNLPLTLAEIAFAGYTNDFMQVAKNLRAPFTYLGRSSETQKAFNEWIVKHLSSNQFPQEQIRVAEIVDSLWEKTKAFVDNHLKFHSKDAMAFQNQQDLYTSAQYQEVTDPEVKKWNGKVFTLAQIELLIQANQSLVALYKKYTDIS